MVRFFSGHQMVEARFLRTRLTAPRLNAIALCFLRRLLVYCAYLAADYVPDEPRKLPDYGNGYRLGVFASRSFRAALSNV